jgi:hypothetical protein
VEDAVPRRDTDNFHANIAPQIDEGIEELWWIQFLCNGKNSQSLSANRCAYAIECSRMRKSKHDRTGGTQFDQPLGLT